MTCQFFKFRICPEEDLRILKRFVTVTDLSYYNYVGYYPLSGIFNRDDDLGVDAAVIFK
jgi:hypothetical protein